MSESTYTLYRGTASTTAGTVLFTTPTDIAVSVDNIVVSNATTAAVAYTLALGTFPIATSTSLAANTSSYINLSQIIYNGETITGSAASASAITFHIAGSDVV
jgi:hypothetical protein